MIGIDTNILVRFLIQDDPEQCLLVDVFLQSLSVEEPGFIPLAVVIELVWVLQKVYRKPKDETISSLESLLQAEEMVVESAHVVWQAVRAYANSNSDFADCLIERSAAQARCARTVTLDGKAAKTAGMVLLES